MGFKFQELGFISDVLVLTHKLILCFITSQIEEIVRLEAFLIRRLEVPGEWSIENASGSSEEISTMIYLKVWNFSIPRLPEKVYEEL